MTKCPYCGKEFLTRSNFCPYCDNEISTKRRKVSNRTVDIINLERIPIKNFILPEIIGLGAIAVIAIIFACII